ncbi:hypothetical protein [Caldisericum sp.]|uniref:hypothetical protein n=1 Tax=Caldisericum sp. TaxID=2499687 RepID=UPI003D14FDF6
MGVFSKGEKLAYEVREKIYEKKLEIAVGERGDELAFVYLWIPSAECKKNGIFDKDTVEQTMKKDFDKIINKLSGLLQFAKVNSEEGKWYRISIDKILGSGFDWGEDKNKINTYISIIKEIDNDYGTSFWGLRF